MKGFIGIGWVTATLTMTGAIACGGTTVGGAGSSDLGNGSSGQGGASAIPPAQAAVAITISAGAMGACRVAGGEITTPPDIVGNIGQVGSSLSCNLTDQSCRPDEHVVFQGDPDTTVKCAVAPNGESFDVSVNVLSGTRMSFSAIGTITATGGTLTIDEFDQRTQATLQDTACSVAILPSQGTVKRGAIWARFQCANFVDPSAAGGDMSCAASGAFIFENCSG